MSLPCLDGLTPCSLPGLTCEKLWTRQEKLLMYQEMPEISDFMGIVFGFLSSIS